MTCVHLGFYTVCAWIVECGRQEGKKKEKHGAVLAAVHYQFPFPFHHSCLLVPFLPTGFLWWCAFTHIFSVFHPNHSAFSSQFSASTTPMALCPPSTIHTGQASQRLVCSIFHHWWRMFYLPCLGHLQWLTHNRKALHHTVAGEQRPKGYGREIRNRKWQLWCQRCCVYSAYLYVCDSQWSKQHNELSTWEHGIKQEECRFVCETYSSPNRRREIGSFQQYQFPSNVEEHPFIMSIMGSRGVC